MKQRIFSGARVSLIVLALWLGAVQCVSATETSLEIDSELGDYIGGGQQYFFTLSDGAFTGQRSPWFNTNNAVYIFYRNASISHAWDLYFGAPNNQPLTVGSYENATRIPFQTPGTPGLDISGNFHGCDTLTGRFTVREIAYGAGNAIDSFWATFEQHCEGAEPALFGEIRFNAHVVVTVSAPARKSVEQGNAISFNVAAKEVNGNIVALTASNVPPGAIFTDNHDNTGTFVWTPGFDQSGPFSITFHADNGLGVADSATTDISVGSLIHVPAEVETIQGAIDSAWSGSRILVAPGFYQENLNFRGKDIKLISEAGPEVTIIDGNQAGPVVTIAQKETRDALLSGFTIQNGRLAGIWIQRASPTVAGNIVGRNVPDYVCTLVGIGVVEGDAIIQGNTVKDNYILCYSSNGGGIGVTGMSSAQILDNVVYGNGHGIGAGGRPGHPTVVRDNIVFDNHSSSGSYYCDGGGGILGADNSIVVQNLVFGNSGTCGGGIWARGNAVISNNTVAGNSGREGSQIYLEFFSGRVSNNIFAGDSTTAAAYCEYPTTPATFRFNNFFNPSGILFDGECSVDITTNISSDPNFVDAPGGDFRLNPGSSVIDRGDNTVPEITELDIDGLDRIVDGNGNGQALIDMGAHEFAPNPGEFNFETTAFSTLENSGTTLITVLRKAGNTGPVSVDFYTVDGTAHAGSDYTATTGSLFFADGETRKTFSVLILDDSIVEGKETVNLHLSNPSGGAILGRQSSAILTINEVGALLTVDANAGIALNITVTPNDNNGQGNGATRFTRLYSKNTSVTLVAPATAGDKNFISWTGCDSVSGATCVVSMSKDKTVTAMYALPSPISILSPTNGTGWRVGTKQAIRWSTAIASNVTVLISRNGGITWTVVSKKTANDGVLIWKVSKPASAQAIIRVCGSTIPAVCADSSPFVIQ